MSISISILPDNLWSTDKKLIDKTFHFLWRTKNHTSVKIFFLLLTGLFAGQSGKAQTASCKSMWLEGTFYYTYEGHETTVVRTKKKQIESTDHGTKQVITKIEWTGDNSYDLYFIKSINSYSLPKGTVMHVKILSCTEQTYKLTATELGQTVEVEFRKTP